MIVRANLREDGRLIYYTDVAWRFAAGFVRALFWGSVVAVSLSVMALVAFAALVGTLGLLKLAWRLA